MPSKRGWTYLCEEHFNVMEKNTRFTVLWFIKLINNDHNCRVCSKENKVKVATHRLGYRYESR